LGYKLVYRHRGVRRESLLDGDRFTIGRQAGQRLTLDDLSVSRQHARLDRLGDCWSVVDTASRNRVLLNGKPIGVQRPMPLRDGDTLTLGAFDVEFVRDDRDRLSMSEDDAVGTQRNSELAQSRPVTAFKDLIPEPSAEERPAAAKELRAARRALRVAADAGRRLASTRPLPEIMDSVVEMVFEATNAERAALLLWDPDARELVPKVVRRRDGGAEPFQVSRSLVQRAFQESCAVKLDRSTRSTLVSQMLLSAVAVPLWEQQHVTGVIYADSTRLADAFDEAGIDLLSALANAAAVALEQASLQLRIRRAQRDRERLGRYLPPIVVERIIADSASDLGLVAQEAEVTILFCDMVGFTSRAETLLPAIVMSMLNHYFGRMTDVIFEHEGTLDKFIGDCLMAAFGAPLAQADHAPRAARAALGLRDAVRELNAASGESLGFRIGLNSGPAVAGDVGSTRRREWTVIGSTVNLASRTESMAQRDQILLTQFTRPLLGPEFEVRSLGTRRPKGMSAEIEMFELVGLSARA